MRLSLRLLLPAIGLHLALAAASLAAQPSSDIYLGSLNEAADSLQVGPPVNITDRQGYDNQPYFSPDGTKIYYTSYREDGQAEIYAYDLAEDAVRRVTETPESEYSPAVMPAGDALSVVRVEADSTQRLWRFGLDGSMPRPVLEDVAPVGYYAWADAGTVALFVLGEPPTLQIADVTMGEARIVAEGIGRSIHKVPGRNAVSFVHKVSEDEWWITELELGSRDLRRLVRTLPGSEDYAWTPDGTLLMGQGPALYRRVPGSDRDWQRIADLRPQGIHRITRLAVSPDGAQIAIVALRPDGD